MTRKALLIDYDYCTGCHSCEIACQVEHSLPVGQWGIKPAEIGPYLIEGEDWQWDYVPIPTKQCDLCESRVKGGEQPTCVKHCQAHVMRYGDVEDLEKYLIEKPRQVMFVPR